MLDRLRIEVVASDTNEASDEIDMIQMCVLENVRTVYPDVVIELTDEYFTPSLRNSRAVVRGRRVVRVYENQRAFHEASGNG